MTTDHETTGPDATDEAHGLVLANEAIAVRLARRYSTGPGIDADLLQVALLGLVLAAERFDPAVGPFRPFAVATVAGEIKKHLRSTGWAARVPRRHRRPRSPPTEPSNRWSRSSAGARPPPSFPSGPGSISMNAVWFAPQPTGRCPRMEFSCFSVGLQWFRLRRRRGLKPIPGPKSTRSATGWRRSAPGLDPTIWPSRPNAVSLAV